MSTAICRIYTKDGFVVAADGLKQNSSGKVICNDTQKIFLIEKPGIRLAYSLAGTVGVTPKDSDEIIFDFYEELRRAICGPWWQGWLLYEMRKRRAETLHWYVTLVGKRVCKKLCAAMAKRKDAYLLQDDDADLERPVDQGGGHTIVDIWFDGFHRGIASTTFLEFFHVNQVATFHVHSTTPPSVVECSGSGAVLRKLSDDGRFGECVLPLNSEWPTLTSPRAIELCRTIIHVQTIPEAHKMDPRKCATIGGLIRIATVTQNEAKFVQN